MDHHNRLFGGGLALIALSAVTPTCAQSPAQNYDLAAQDLKYALRAMTRQAGYELVAPADLLEGRKAAALKGRFTPEQAAERLLAGSDLAAEAQGRTLYIRARTRPRPDASPRADAGDGADDADIIVTGSRLRGAPVASPSITISRETMRAAGQHSLAEVIRTIPQNFGGGHNAGVGLNVPESNGVNTGAAVTLNLRGLGSDATLTLLNGHRLSYSAVNQAIDISTIPVAAIERLDIMPDGASALYGSDAVAGVANIVLRRNFDGLETAARLGASTEGGFWQQQYGAVGGRAWDGGGILLAYEFGRDTAIQADQRAYAAPSAPGLTLYPAIKRHSAIASAHQAITSWIRFEVDALYNRRSSHSQYAFDLRGDPLASGARTQSRSLSFAIAPSLRFELGSNWTAALSGMIGEDRTRYGFAAYADGTPIFEQRGCYCNKATSLELAANGDLVALPAGNAKLALGGGIRTNNFSSIRSVGGDEDIRVSQDTYYAFGELGLPLISPGQGSPIGERLYASAALRYEKYPHVDEVLTPKLGLIYAPTSDIELKASWGRSFKAPRLYEQYNSVFATLYTAASRGGTASPADATAILLSGGNPGLKPEHATTWSATAVLHPDALPGLRAEATYYHIDYRDRIVTPIRFPSQSLSDPIYADLITPNPSPAAQAAAIAGAVFQSAIAAPYDPAKVVALISNTALNAARQTIRGIDASLTYDATLPDGARLGLLANASYLRSRQKLSPLQPETQLAGTLFNVPHFRARAGASWARDGVSLAGFVNHIGSLKDPRLATVLKVDAMTTIDLSARYATGAGRGLLDNLSFGLTVQNLFGTNPSRIRATLPFEAPYDSTNHNAFGRVVSFEVTKSW